MGERIEELAIIGSGPAGYTAAVYAARAGLRPVVLEGFEAGGALTATTGVENFPGFPDGVQGPDLVAAMRKQALRFGAELRAEDATSVDLAGPVKEIRTDTAAIRAHAVVVATGSRHKRLGLPDEERLTGRGVSTCATCDGFFFRDKDIAVVGGGDTAMEEALYLTRFARSVTVVHRRDRLRASAIMQERALGHSRIRFLWSAEVVGLTGEQTLTGIRTHGPDGELHLPVDGLFVAIGHQPRSEVFAGQLDRDESGYLLAEHPTTATNLPGVFAAGDVVDHRYRQAITAAGTGCSAALDAQAYLAAFGRDGGRA
ncbi:thioredoxin-disulfide reductase [Amycolatopsis sp. A1MSW2902]|uniref:thioredoxin-disulfide reductase n=1 Tax=Amycolatopsis sp. A1MSW2902 TaxID=687413 RepID=UPI00307F805B